MSFSAFFYLLFVDFTEEDDDFDSDLDDELLLCDAEVPDLKGDDLLAGVLIVLPEGELVFDKTVVFRPDEEDDLTFAGVLEGVLTALLLLSMLVITLSGTLTWFLILLLLPSFLFPKFPLLPLLLLLLLLP